MRNLKKILALVLALMMVLSMMVTASAADFTDMEKVSDKYVNAVDIMTALGVIGGIANNDEEGTFRFEPQSTLTRAQAAKIIAYISEGNLENIEMLIDGLTHPFEDVANAHWANSVITYCYNKGIIAGRTATSFDPNGVITGFEFGKMLLVAAGFLTGDDYKNADSWTILTSSTLTVAGVWNSKDFPLSEKLTRERACYLAYNIMEKSPSGDTVTYVVKNDVNGFAKNFTDVVAAKAYCDAMNAAFSVTDYELTVDITPADSLLAKSFGSYTHVGVLGTDDFGRPETDKWTKTVDGETETIHVTYAEPMIVVEGATLINNAKAWDAFTFSGTTKYFYNGVEGVVTTSADLAKAGLTSEIYATYDAETEKYVVSTVVAYEYEVLTIDAIAEKTGNIDVTVGKGDVKVTVAAPADEKAEPSELYTILAGYAKGDVLTVIAKPGYTTDETKLVILEHALAEAVHGTITAIKSDADVPYFRMDDGDTLKLANTYAETTKVELKVVGNAYLAPNGYVLTVVKDTVETPEIATDYIYVITKAAIAAQAGKAEEGDGLFGTIAGTAGTAAKAQALVLDLYTQEISIVNLGVVKANDGKYYYAKADGTASATEVTKLDPNYTKGSEVGFVKYSVLADGSYVLGEPALTTGLNIQKGAVVIKDGLIATSDTKLNSINVKVTLGKDDDAASWNDVVAEIKLDTKNGYTNFPKEAEKITSALVISDEETGVVSAIYTVNLAEFVPAPTATKQLAVYVGTGETNANGTAYGFYVNGEYVEYYTAKDITVSATAGTLYELTLDGGKIAANVTTGVSTTDGKIAFVDPAFILIGNTAHTLNKPVVVDADNNYALGEYEVGDTVKLVLDKDSKVVFILIDNP